MKTLAIALLLTFGSLVGRGQTTVDNATFPPTLTHNTNNLVLNGEGVRKKMLFNVYSAGLYLHKKSKNGNAICEADRLMVLRLQITSGMANSSNMTEAIREGFSKSAGANIAALQDRIDTFVDVFNREKIKEGDIFEIWYVPGMGVQPFKNGNFQANIEGLDFKKALFGIWLSDKPADASLKKSLLGRVK